MPTFARRREKWLSKNNGNKHPNVVKLDVFAICGEARADTATVIRYMTGYKLKKAGDRSNGNKSQ